MIVALEGIDSSGKATHAKRLEKKLDAKLFSFPAYETVSGQLIKGFLMDWDTLEKMFHRDRLAAMFQCLQVTNRVEALSDIVRTMHSGKSIIFDRYVASALTYGAIDGCDINWLADVNSIMPPPDVNILLDITVDESFKRRPERRDAIERNRVKLERVAGLYREVFLDLATRDPYSKWVIVDGNRSVEEVAASIDEAIATITPRVLPFAATREGN